MTTTNGSTATHHQKTPSVTLQPGQTDVVDARAGSEGPKPLHMSPSMPPVIMQENFGLDSPRAAAGSVTSPSFTSPPASAGGRVTASSGGGSIAPQQPFARGGRSRQTFHGTSALTAKPGQQTSDASGDNGDSQGGGTIGTKGFLSKLSTKFQRR